MNVIALMYHYDISLNIYSLPILSNDCMLSQCLWSWLVGWLFWIDIGYSITSWSST